MVNETKRAILQAIQNSTSPQNGESLASVLGISRVAVWKHIKALKEMGYPIESSHNGYRLKESPDKLNALEFPDYKSPILSYNQVTSTMDKALKMAVEGAEEGTLIFADSQDMGRGQSGNPWQSPQGNLYFTLITRPEKLSRTYLRRLSLLAAVSWCQTMEQNYQLPMKIEWPNSLILEGKKAGGILIESLSRGEKILFANIGMGINLQIAPQTNRATTSLASHLKTPPNRKEIFQNFKERWDRNQDILEGSSLISQWEKRAMYLNRKVIGRSIEGPVQGLFTGLDSQGNALLQNNKMIQVCHGSLKLVL